MREEEMSVELPGTALIGYTNLIDGDEPVAQLHGVVGPHTRTLLFVGPYAPDGTMSPTGLATLGHVLRGRARPLPDRTAAPSSAVPPGEDTVVAIVLDRQPWSADLLADKLAGITDVVNGHVMRLGDDASPDAPGGFPVTTAALATSHSAGVLREVAAMRGRPHPRHYLLPPEAALDVSDLPFDVHVRTWSPDDPTSNFDRAEAPTTCVPRPESLRAFLDGCALSESFDAACAVNAMAAAHVLAGLRDTVSTLGDQILDATGPDRDRRWAERAPRRARLATLELALLGRVPDALGPRITASRAPVGVGWWTDECTGVVDAGFVTAPARRITVIPAQGDLPTTHLSTRFHNPDVSTLTFAGEPTAQALVEAASWGAPRRVEVVCTNPAAVGAVVAGFSELHPPGHVPDHTDPQVRLRLSKSLRPQDLDAAGRDALTELFARDPLGLLVQAPTLRPPVRALDAQASSPDAVRRGTGVRRPRRL